MMKIKLFPEELIPVRVAFKRKVEQDNSLHFLRIYLKFGYALYFIPFKVVLVKRNGVYSIKSSELHRVS